MAVPPVAVMAIALMRWPPGREMTTLTPATSTGIMKMGTAGMGITVTRR
jgi:hypothetical protein